MQGILHGLLACCLYGILVEHEWTSLASWPVMLKHSILASDISADACCAPREHASFRLPAACTSLNSLHAKHRGKGGGGPGGCAQPV